MIKQGLATTRPNYVMVLVKSDDALLALVCASVAPEKASSDDARDMIQEVTLDRQLTLQGHSVHNHGT